MSGIFNALIFNNAIFNTAAVVEEPEVAAEVEITARPPNVDFVISSPYYLSRIPIYRNAKVEKNQDERELREMMQMYAIATKATGMRT